MMEQKVEPVFKIATEIILFFLCWAKLWYDIPFVIGFFTNFIEV